MRFTLSGAAQKPRLNVFRSLSHIYAQLIDDTANQGQGHTILSVSTVEKEVAEKVKGLKKVDAAKVVGEIVAKRAKEKGIEEVVFDRGGYRYTGRIAAVARRSAQRRIEGLGGIMAIENKERKGEFKPRDKFTRRRRQEDTDDGIITKTVSVNRVTKVVKGGRNMRFAALVVAGDGQGRVGAGLGKAERFPKP